MKQCCVIYGVVMGCVILMEYGEVWDGGQMRWTPPPLLPLHHCNERFTMLVTPARVIACVICGRAV